MDLATGTDSTGFLFFGGNMLNEFWNGFEKRAGIFNWGKDALKAAPGVAAAAEKIVKPGLMESLKNVAGDVADISGKIRANVDSPHAQEIMGNAARITGDVGATVKAMKPILMGLGGTAMAGMVVSIPLKWQGMKAKKEELRYFQNMNRQFDEKK